MMMALNGVFRAVVVLGASQAVAFNTSIRLPQHATAAAAASRSRSSSRMVKRHQTARPSLRSMTDCSNRKNSGSFGLRLRRWTSKCQHELPVNLTSRQLWAAAELEQVVTDGIETDVDRGAFSPAGVRAKFCHPSQKTRGSLILASVKEGLGICSYGPGMGNTTVGEESRDSVNIARGRVSSATPGMSNEDGKAPSSSSRFSSVDVPLDQGRPFTSTTPPPSKDLVRPTSAYRAEYDDRNDHQQQHHKGKQRTSASPIGVLLPSDPIARFSRRKDSDKPGKNIPLASTSTFASGIAEETAPRTWSSPSSLLARLSSELRSRADAMRTAGWRRDTHSLVLTQQDKHQQSNGADMYDGLDHCAGLSELCSAIAHIEAKLSADSSEATQLRVSRVFESHLV